MEENDVFEQEYEKFMKELDAWILETKSMLSKNLLFLKKIQNKYDNWEKGEKIRKYDG